MAVAVAEALKINTAMVNIDLGSNMSKTDWSTERGNTPSPKSSQLAA
jgi:hypothetical protein